MLYQQSHFRARNEAAYEFLREILSGALDASHTALSLFLSYLFQKKDRKGIEVVDLNVLFRFIAVGGYLLVIPKACFCRDDILLFKHFRDFFCMKPERVEFTEEIFSIDPNVNLPGYIRDCMKKATFD